MDDLICDGKMKFMKTKSLSHLRCAFSEPEKKQPDDNFYQSN